MSRTIRKNNPKLVRSILRNRAEDATVQAWRPSNLNHRWNRHNDALLRGQDGVVRSDKCQTAQIDSEGGYKLDTSSECHTKHHGREAKRKLRRTGKIQITRQLEY